MQIGFPLPLPVSRDTGGMVCKCQESVHVNCLMKSICDGFICKCCGMDGEKIGSFYRLGILTTRTISKYERFSKNLNYPKKLCLLITEPLIFIIALLLLMAIAPCKLWDSIIGCSELRVWKPYQDIHNIKGKLHIL
jgi:hypothetical protein